MTERLLMHKKTKEPTFPRFFCVSCNPAFTKGMCLRHAPHQTVDGSVSTVFFSVFLSGRKPRHTVVIAPRIRVM